MSGHFLFMHINEWADFETPDAIPLSQGYILANLKEYGFSGQILGDYKNRPLAPQLFKTLFQSIKPHAVGFSVYEENINRVRAWARFAKSINPEVTVVLGGPQTTFMPCEALQQMSEVDVLCRGEGETVMLSLAQALTNKTPLSNVPGICFLENNKPLETGPEQGPDYLDELPSPYLKEVLDTTGKSRVILLSSRGCTSPCTFCYTPRASGKKVRFHSIDRITDEMCYLKKQGIKDFWFADPNFAYSRSRLETLLEAIVQKVPGVKFWCQTRYNLIDYELLDLLKRAGAHTIAFGLESAHPGVLKNINKGLDTDKMSEAIKLVQEAGIEVELFSLYGLPGETVDNAMQTLDYVKQNKVAINGNSISQQLHIFFGTPIGDEPACHDIEPLPLTKPAYQSICRDFTTGAMTEQQIRQMSLLWRLNRTDFAEDINNGRNLFTIASFITRNREMLCCRPEADSMLARIYMQLDEYAMAACCMQRLAKKFNSISEVQHFLNGPFAGYKSKRRGVAGRNCKVIFDGKGMIRGSVAPETECHYHIATLGDGTLLDDFEKGLIGMKAGSAGQFDVTFPEDYGNSKLAGKRATFQVYLHQVLEPVIYDTLDAMQHNPPRNMYRFDDLIGLQKHNENLYYMVLRDSILHSFTGNLNDMMALFNYYLKLGFTEKALDIAHSLPQEPSIMGHVGRVLLANGLAADALDFLEQAAETNVEMENQRIKALIKVGQFEEAEKIAANPKLGASLQILNQQVTLASLQQLPVTDYLERMDNLLDCQVKMMHANM